MKKSCTFLLFSFITQIVMANDFVCDTQIDKYYALYDANTYECAVWEYLPANTLGCRPCPSGFICSGGTFDFNPNYFQGINLINTIPENTMNNICAVNFPSNITAIYTPNVHTCAVGKYLPANVDGCMPCLENNYCPGGVYVFNETQNQGLAPCPDAHPFAPGGMWLESQCGRKMHVGDDVLYLHSAPAAPTVKRLYVRFNNAVYSANATEKEFAPATMSERATRALHVLIDGVEYLIHDDSAR